MNLICLIAVFSSFKKKRGGRPRRSLSLSIRLVQHSSCISFATHWLVVLSYTCFAAPFLRTKKKLKLFLPSGESCGIMWRMTNCDLSTRDAFGTSMSLCNFMVYRRWLFGLRALLLFAICSLCLLALGTSYHCGRITKFIYFCT